MRGHPGAGAAGLAAVTVRNALHINGLSGTGMSRPGASEDAVRRKGRNDIDIRLAIRTVIASKSIPGTFIPRPL